MFILPEDRTLKCCEPSAQRAAVPAWLRCTEVRDTTNFSRLRTHCESAEATDRRDEERSQTMYQMCPHQHRWRDDETRPTSVSLGDNEPTFITLRGASPAYLAKVAMLGFGCHGDLLKQKAMTANA